MLPDDLLSRYLAAKQAYDAVCKELEVYYGARLEAVMAANDRQAALDLAIECPDNVICVLMLDAINHYDWK